MLKVFLMLILPLISAGIYLIRIQEIKRLKGHYIGLFIRPDFNGLGYGKYTLELKQLPNLVNAISSRNYTFVSSSIILPLLIIVGVVDHLEVVEKLIILIPMVLYAYLNAVVFERYCDFIKKHKPHPNGPTNSRFVTFESIGMITWLDESKTTTLIKLCRDCWFSLFVVLFIFFSI